MTSDGSGLPASPANARTPAVCSPLCSASKAYGRFAKPWQHEPQCPVRMAWAAEKDVILCPGFYTVKPRRGEDDEQAFAECDICGVTGPAGSRCQQIVIA